MCTIKLNHLLDNKSIELQVMNKNNDFDRLGEYEDSKYHQEELREDQVGINVKSKYEDPTSQYHFEVQDESAKPLIKKVSILYQST